MRLVMHIGSHKAGSTSIQEFCRSAPDTLLQGGIHYPVGGLPRHPEQHSALKDLVQDNRLDELRAYLARARAEAEARGAATVLLSGEDLCVLGPGLAHRFHAVARELFDAIEIVLLLRNKRDYFYSAYKHHLLHAAPIGEAAFVASQGFAPRRTVQAWRQIKGVTLHVLSFDALKTDLLGGFFARVFGLRVEARIEANRSLDFLSLQAVNALAKPRDGGIDRGALQVVLRARAGRRPPALPVEDIIADGIAARFPDEDWQIDEVPGLLERRPMAPPGEPPSAALCAEIAALYCALQSYFSATESAPAKTPASAG